MLEFDDAQARLLAVARPPATVQTCALAHAAGRVLAHSLVARLDLPPADNSAMDGYAVRHTDLRPGVVLPIGQIAYAGQVPTALLPGQAARITTGGLVPPCADTVVIQEDCEPQAAAVRVLAVPALGSNIRRRGEDVALGSPLAPAGTVLTPMHLGLLAAQGWSEVPVWPRLRVAILTTGDELVPPGQPLPPGAIHESNGILLQAALAQLGCEVVAVRHVADDLPALQEALRQLAGMAQLIVTTGGVSVGDRDLVKPALEALGGELALWKVRMKPGKPVALGQVAGVPVLGLPGNPVSALVVLAVLASPMIRRWQGRLQPVPAVWPARLCTTAVHTDKREAFLRVQAEATAEGWQVRPHPQQSSGILHGLSWATGVARLPAGVPHHNGASVAYYPFEAWLR